MTKNGRCGCCYSGGKYNEQAIKKSAFGCLSFRTSELASDVKNLNLRKKPSPLERVSRDSETGEVIAALELYSLRLG